MATIIHHAPSRELSGSADDKSVADTLKFNVVADEPLESSFLVLTDPRTPKPGDHHPDPNMRGLRVMKLRPRSEDGVTFELLVDYSIEAGKREAENPIARPGDLSMRSNRLREFSRFNADDNTPLLNTAGDPLAPQEIERSIKIFSIEKNIPVEYPEWLEDFDNTISTGDVYFAGKTRKKKTLLGSDLTISKIEEERTSRDRVFRFRILQMSVAWNPRGWNVDLLNEGFNEIVDVPFIEERNGQFRRRTRKEKRRIKLDSREYPAQPLLLDKDGKAFRDPNTGNLLDRIPPEEIVTIDFRPYRLADLGSLLQLFQLEES